MHASPHHLSIARTLRKLRSRLTRKVEAIRGDLAEADRAPTYRRQAEALLAYLHKVPKRAHTVVLPDPADEASMLEITLDPALNAQGNAARLFKRAAKGERGTVEIRARLRTAEAELADLSDLIERAKLLDRPDLDPEERDGIERDLELAAKKLPPALRAELASSSPAATGSGTSSRRAPQHVSGHVRPAHPPEARGAPGHSQPSDTTHSSASSEPAPAPVVHRPNPPRPKGHDVPARLQPRRLKTTEDEWPVLIGRSNEGNDHLTLHMARPEDYWFHVHGAAGSHVVLRRGKGKNEPSKRTLEEVAAWAAFYSQARTAGRVPVIWTLKKYVRKPRGAKAGSVVCEREKSIMVRPQEPARANLAGEESAD